MAAADKATPPPKDVLPPGMVMGADGKPCKICTAFRNYSPRKTANTQHDQNRPVQTWPAASTNHSQKGTLAGSAAATVAAAGPSSPTTGNTPEVAPPVAMSYRSEDPPAGCPPDVEQLGRATWTFLHTTAAYYPEKPTPSQRANMLMLLGSLPVLYPCGWCAKDFGESIQKTKPDVSGRVALSRWLCNRHNEVNEKLGKDKFDCAKVDERWKDGPPDDSCE